MSCPNSSFLQQIAEVMSVPHPSGRVILLHSRNQFGCTSRRMGSRNLTEALVTRAVSQASTIQFHTYLYIFEIFVYCSHFCEIDYSHDVANRLGSSLS